MIVRARVNFEYPKDFLARERIRRSRVHPYPGDRGPIVQVLEGAVFRAPEDLVEGWLERGLVEPAEEGDLPTEEAA